MALITIIIMGMVMVDMGDTAVCLEKTSFSLIKVLH
jgi:hypothetical protein